MSRRPAVELVWPGKYGPDGERTEPPARAVSLRPEVQVGPAPARDRLICGDNLLALDALLREHEGAVDLVYIDPPFSTGHAFERTAQVGDEDGPELRVHAYCDRWSGGLAGFLQMLDPRLRRLHRLLAPHGSLYVHVDPIVGHAVKLLLDEIFGPGCFQREIVWRIGWVSGFKARANNWIRNHDLIFFYVKDPQRFVFNRQVVPHPPEYRRRQGADTKQGGVPVEDVWNASPAEWNLRGAESLDSIQIKSFSREKTGWATQKNESLLRRIVAASSRPGALVVDVFCGAGTTLSAAQALGRRWIGCDSAAAAIELAQARLSQRAGASFVRCAIDGERAAWLAERGDAWPAGLIKIRRGEAAGGALTGVADEVGLLVGPLEGAVSAEAVRAAARAAADRGLARLEVLAWAWEFPAGVDLAGETGVDVVCLQLRRELLDPRLGGRPELLWGERPAVAVQFVAEPGEDGPKVRAELVELKFAHPERLPAALRDRDGRALVEAWAIALDDVGGPLRADFTAARTRNHRDLAVRTDWATLAGAGPWTARARVVDATGGESWHRWRLSRSEAGIAAEPVA
jgi:DNA modification methylase